MTRERLLNAQNAAVGDPGLLVSNVLPNMVSKEKKHAIGIVPHYWDKEDPQVERFFDCFPDAKFLDVFNDVETFIREMTECEFIMSSSLHGLIMADAFQIPNQWIVVSDRVEGKNFKFYDYYSVFDMASPEFSDLDSMTIEKIQKLKLAYQRPGLGKIQQDIVRSFPDAYR